MGLSLIAGQAIPMPIRWAAFAAQAIYSIKETHMKSKGSRNAASATTYQAAVSDEVRSSKESTPADLQDAITGATVRRTWNAPKPTDPPLIRVLLKEANRRGHQMTNMSAALDCTYGYIAQLRCGHRKPEHIGQEFAEHAAAYLGVPTAAVKLLAGRVTMSDFAWPNRSREDDIAACLEALRDDISVGAYVPAQLFEAEPEVQEFVWRLYEECSGRHALGLRSLPKVLDYLQRAALNEAGFEVELQELRDRMDEATSATTGE